MLSGHGLRSCVAKTTSLISVCRLHYGPPTALQPKLLLLPRFSTRVPNPVGDIV